MNKPLPAHITSHRTTNTNPPTDPESGYSGRISTVRPHMLAEGGGRAEVNKLVGDVAGPAVRRLSDHRQEGVGQARRFHKIEVRY